MKKYTFEENLISVAIGCCLAGRYLALYMFHLVPIERAMPKRVIEPIPVDISEVNIELPLIAIDTYATVEDYLEEVDTGYITTIYFPNKGKLTAKKGIFNGPSGKETWYNRSMMKVVQSMRNRGYSELQYPYSVRDDGVKMLGDYIIVAADLTKYKKGDLVETSLGTGIVCDTGSFTDTTDVEIDIATEW